MIRRILVLAVSAAALLAAAAFAPYALHRRDPLPPDADAIYVLPGKLETRARCAARLFRAGHAPWLIFTGGRIRPELRALGFPLTEAEVGAEFATRAGVPPESQVVLPTARSTWEDAAALGRWARESGQRRIIAVTSPTHARRAGESLRLALAPLGGEVFVHTCETFYTPRTRWWRYEQPLVEVNNEFLKLLLYTTQYFVPTWLGLRPPPGSEPAPTAPPAAP